MIEAHLLSLLHFEKLFEVNCDVLREFLAKMGGLLPISVIIYLVQRIITPHMIWNFLLFFKVSNIDDITYCKRSLSSL